MTFGNDLDPVTSPAASLLAIAPPGCGKTELLARRAAYLAQELPAHQQILALTFSNRATRNLRERLLRAIGPQRFRRIVRVTNFHGHAAGIIRAHGRTLGLDPDLPMPGRKTLSDAIERFTRGLQLGDAIKRKKGIESALSEAKRGPFDDDQVQAMLVRSGNEYAQQIEDDRRAAGILHYDDLLRHAQRLLQVEAIAGLYQVHYGAVLVDEFQDLSLQHLDIALASCSARRTFVGDPLQGIYSWAGALPAGVESRLRELCGEPYRLSLSYRSSPAVLGVVNQIARGLGGQPLTAADPQAWPGGGVAAAGVFPSADAEARWIVETAERIMIADATATIGVITRAGWRRGEVDAAFACSSQVPHQQWDLAIEDSEITEQLLDVVAQLPQNTDIAAVRHAVLDRIAAEDVEMRERVAEAVDAFAQMAAEAGSPAKAANRLRTRESEDAIEPGVHLLNAHTGKGQQFDWVFVPGLEEFHIPSPHANTEMQLEEERRVLLVMLSRARRGVVVTRAESRMSKAGRPYATTASRWWAETEAVCPRSLSY